MAEERQHLLPPQLFAEKHLTRDISPVGLKHILRQVEADCDNLRHDRSPMRILADPPWHTDAVGVALLMAWMPPPDGIVMCQCGEC